MKVENTRSGIYHMVEKELGNNTFKTVCGLTVVASQHYNGTERWIQELDAWICNCESCNRITKSRKKEITE